MFSRESDGRDGPAAEDEVGVAFDLAGAGMYGVGVDSRMGTWGGGFQPVGLACNRLTVLPAGSSPPTFSDRTFGS